MQTGKISKLTDRGFGFIAVAGREKDLFFHSNSLSGVTFDDLHEGDMLQFEITPGDKGDSATNVTRADAGAPAAAEEVDAEEENEDAAETV